MKSSSFGIFCGPSSFNATLALIRPSNNRHPLIILLSASINSSNIHAGNHSGSGAVHLGAGATEITGDTLPTSCSRCLILLSNRH